MGVIEASQLVAALEVAWSAIQGRHEDVPDVVVTLGAGSIGVARGTLKLGHFAADRWSTDAGSSAELFVGGEGLQRGASEVLATLLHEAAHGVATVRKVQDTSRQGRYHNARFKHLGEELGLLITQVPGIGWSGTALGEQTRQTYADVIADLQGAITAYRHSEGFLPGLGPGDDGSDAGGEDDAGGGDAGGRRPKNGVVLACSCPRKLRMSASAAELGPVLCAVCDEPFAPTH